MSVEAAALAVGKAVGERAGRLWLAGRTAEAERDKDLVELIQVRFPDRIARRRVERQLADIADSVTERLLAVCGHEYGGLSPNDKAAALAEVTETLTTADLSDQVLLAVDTDPVKLSRRVRDAPPARGVPEQLGAAGARLYDVVLDECCDCLVRIVRQLPQFGPRASAETLARLSGLAEQVGAVLSRLPVRSLDAPDGTADDEEFRRRYLEHVSTTLDEVELFGVRVERYRPRTTLSVAYISLSVSTEDGERGLRRSASGGHELRIADWRGDDRRSEHATVRVESALGQTRLRLIRGEAGSGKSTLLRWLAVTAARGAFTSDLADWNGCVPFLIKLRSHADRELPPPERFLDGVADPIAGLMPTGWVHRRLLNGRALLLVDGVDELVGAQRRAVRPWLGNLIAAYPGIRVIVTSRSAAAGSDWLAAEGFAAAFLERMNSADVRALIRHWHAAVRDAGGLPCAPDELPAYEKALLARMEGASHLRMLASSPLLASMVCALNLDRETQLPRDRMGLYAAALEMLLERRDAERRIPSFQDVALEREQQVQILQDLAWRLSVTNRTELPKAMVLRRVAEKVATMPRVTASAEAVLEHLVQRSGVLREPVPGRVDFVHRTVQEYLTAKQAADDGDMEPLIAGAHRDQWHEIIVMAAGHANAPLRRELLAGLLERIRSEPRHARRLKLLIAACLETLPTVPPDLGDDVEACLRDLIPPRDLASARSLSSSGEPVLDRLPQTLDGLSAASARAIVRTAWLINGPRALDVLTRYGGDHRESVQEELVHGWNYFDPVEYAKRVLAHTPLPDGSLRIENRDRSGPATAAATLLPAVRHLPQLSQLTLWLASVPNLSVITGTPCLYQLLVDEIQSGDLRPLIEHAETLTWLSIKMSKPIENWSLLPQLRNLTQLDLGAPGMTDLGFVRRLPSLTRLSLRGLEEITDFSPLAAQTSLRNLELYGCTHLSSIEMLPPLGNLGTLALTRSALSCGLAHLVTQIPKIKQLYFNHSSWINDLAPLAKLPFLRSLGLWGCTHVDDLTPLAGLSQLRFLDLEETAVHDLTPLAGLTELETLWLRDCSRVRDLTPLGALRKLRHLYIRGVAPGIDLAPLARNRRVNVYIGADQHVRDRELLGRRLRASAAVD